jgi:hypothetical protein
MAKNIPSALKAFLLSEAAQSCYVANLFAIALVSGQQIFATDGQLPITYGGHTYQPTQFGSWSFKSIDTEVGMTASSETFNLQANADVLLTPFNVSILECVQLGLFDGATWTHYRVFMPTGDNPGLGPVWGNTSLGAEIKFGGQITRINTVGRTTAEGTVEAYTFKLNQPMPRHVLQPGCRWALYSTGCTVNKASFTYSGSVNGTSGPSVTPNAAISLPTGITLAQGYLTFTSGQNTGLSIGIASYASGGNIVLDRTPLLPVAHGDTFTVSAGCDHTMGTCALFQPSTWQANFGGDPFIPNTETAL